MIFGLFRRHIGKLVFGLMCTIILLLALDTSIARLYTLIYGTIFVGNNVGIPTEWNTFGFTLITAFCLVGQFIILKAVTERTKEMRTKGSLHLAIVQKLVYVVVSGLIAIFIFMVLQMEFTSSFNLSLLATFVGLSYTLGAIVMGYLASRFFLWFKVNKNSVVLAYTLASLMLFINITFTLVYVLYLLTDQPEIMRPHSGHMSAAIFEDSILYQGYVISSILSFVMTWIATSLLMRHHSTRLGTIKYWLVVGVPLAYFLIQFAPSFLNLFNEFSSSDPVTFEIIRNFVFGLSRTVGGILFGIAFWTISRRIGQTPVREYMIISAYGFILLFVSNQAIFLVNYNYPPFGLATISYVGLSSFLVLIGIYSAAISVGRDIELRNLIRKSAQKEAGLLHNIGSAQMERQITNVVLAIARRNEVLMKEETGLATSLEDEEIVRYTREVLKEVTKAKAKR